MNTNIKLENFIDERFDIIISKECYYGYLNTGSFLIKNTQWSHELLQRIYYADGNFEKFTFWEQDSLRHLLSIDRSLWSHFKIVHQRVLNSNLYFTPAISGWYHHGDFVIHFFGNCDKVRLMKAWSQKVVY